MSDLFFEFLYRKAERLIKLAEQLDLDTLEVPIFFGLFGSIKIERHVYRPPVQPQTITQVTPAEPVAELADIKSPMVGTFFPKVVVGQEINADDVIGIIEAMRLENEITSDVSGIVAKILVPADPDFPVEFGQPLIRVVTKITHC